MKAHPTQQQLIDYLFELTVPDQLDAVAAHVDACKTCRNDLELLKRKFASLDLLRDEIKVSDTLLARTLEQAARRPAGRILPFGIPLWAASTAAVIVIGLVLLLTGTLTRTPPHEAVPTTSQDMADKTDVRGRPGGEKKELAPHGVSEDMAALAQANRPDAPTEPLAASRKPSFPILAGSSRPTEQEQPPFAPASAIELVVLPRRQSVQLTIYNSADLTLVRERRNLTLKKGWNWLQFMWANTLIDPTSISLEPVKQTGEVETQQLVFPPRLRDLGRWLIHSDVSGQIPFELTYFTSGLTWRAFYTGTLAPDQRSMYLQGYVRVDNSSGEDYADAQTRLIVGKVHLLDQIADLAKRQHPYGQPQPFDAYSGFRGQVAIRGRRRLEERAYFGLADEAGAVIEKFSRKEIVKEGLSEYFLYTIEGTETIPDKWGKRLLSFEAEDIPVESLYKYDEQRWGPQTIRFLSFANDTEHNLGQTPIPDGQVRVFRSLDEHGHLSYIGAAPTKYIPVNEEVELNLGPARLVEVKPTLMEFKTANYLFDRRDNIAGWDEIHTWKIRITNAAALPVKIEITRGFDTAYWTLECNSANVSYKKHDATRARFELIVQPGSERAFEYTVTTYHGEREAVFEKLILGTEDQ